MKNTKANPDNRKTRRARKVSDFAKLGVVASDFRKLCQLERALHKWGEDYCNGDVFLDEETGQAFRHFKLTDYSPEATLPTDNREVSALASVASVMSAYPALWFFHQSDPRGCALYVGRRKGCDMSALDCNYSSWGQGVYLPD